MFQMQFVVRRNPSTIKQVIYHYGKMTKVLTHISFVGVSGSEFTIWDRVNIK